MIGSCTSAITKRHVKSRRSPRFRLREVHPYVGMVGSVQGIACALLASRQELAWEDAQVGSSVH